MTVSSEKIVALRNDLGWSQRKLAIVSGVSERTIQRIEQDGSSCSLETKLALAAAFDVPAPALSPVPAGTELPDSLLERRLPGASPLRVGLVLCAIYFMVFSGFNFPAALTVVIVSVVTLTLAGAAVSMTRFGFAATRALVTELRWADAYPQKVSELEERVRQIQLVIVSLYVLGLFLPHLLELAVKFVVVFLLGLSFSGHPVLEFALNPGWLNTLIPGGYFVVALLMAECWLRPHKRKLEKTAQLTR